MPAKKQPKRSLKKTVRKVINSLKLGAGPRINPDAIKTGPRRKKVVRAGDVFIMGPGGKKKRKPVGDPKLRASDVFIMGPDGKRKRKPAVPKKNTKKRKM